MRLTRDQRKHLIQLLDGEGSADERLDAVLKGVEQCDNLLDELIQAVYIADVDTYEILYMNQAAKELLSCKDYAGQKCFRVMQGMDSPCEFCTSAKLKTDETYIWEHYNKTLGRAYQLQDRLIDYAGHKARIEIVFDVDEHISRENELQTVLEKERKLVEAIQVANAPDKIDNRINTVLRICGEYLEADRAYVFNVDDSGDTVSNTYEWCKDGIEPQISNLQRYDIHYIDRWMPYFIKQESIATPDIEEIRESKPDEYRVMVVQGIHSYIEAPLISNGDFIGFIGVDNPSVNKMLNSGETLLSLAYSVSDAMVAAAKEQELINAEARHDLADSIADMAIWEYHIKEHRITNPNSYLKDLGIPEIIENVPESILPLFLPEDEERILDQFKRIEAGESQVTADFWMKWNRDTDMRNERIMYSVRNDEFGEPAIAFGIGVNITEQTHERERFQKMLRSLLKANPDSIGSYHINLTKNTFLGGDSSSSYIENALVCETADEFLARAATLFANENERAAYVKRFNRESLLAAAESGETNLSMEYQSLRGNREHPCVRTYFSLVRNPETGDIECVTYALDITKQKLRDMVFHILSDKEYDYVALLHLKTKKFEFLNLSSNLLPKYHTSLQNPAGAFDYSTIREYAVSTFIAEEDHELYFKESTIENITANLEKSQSFDINVRGHYTGHPNEFMYRKIQHYYLDETKETVLLVQSDVTDVFLQQQKETELAKTEAQYVADIIDSVGAGICVFRMPDADHLEGDFVNMQMFRILGLTPPDGPDARQKMLEDPMVDAYMKDAFIAVYPDDRAEVKRIFHDGFNSSHFDAGNYRVIKKDGGTVWVNQNAMLREIRPECHVFYASYRVMDREIELHNELEQQLEKEKLLRDQADAANAAKSDFLSRMSHDIRTPLNGIIGMTYLTQEMDLPDKAHENLNKIDTSSKFLLSLINEVLDMSKAESGKIEMHPEPYDSSDFFDYLNSVIVPLCQEKNIRFVVDAKPETGVVPLIDSLRINQVFFNLLSNAVKFTPEGGTVSYRLREHINDKGLLVLEAEVSDTGIGMSEEFQKHLFEPFSQETRDDNSEMRGTGLGLAITKKLLDLMGCRIWVKSELGKGTTFFLHGAFECVPVGSDAAKDETEVGFDASNLKSRKVLLCEDHPLNQEIAKTLLSEKGIIVEIAEDGCEGFQTFSDSAVDYYDAILMDIRMPVMDGYECARAIRALDREDAKRVPIIAMTADAFSEDVGKCFDAGMDGHIAKPIDPSTLYQALADAMAQRES